MFANNKPTPNGADSVDYVQDTKADNVIQLHDILVDPIITDSYVILATDATQHADMLAYLDNADKGYVEVEGGYQMFEYDADDGNFVTERSVIVSLATALDLARCGWLDDQESVLHIFNKDHRNYYRAELIYMEGQEVKDMGWLYQVTEEVALANPDGYTFRPRVNGVFETGEGHYFIASLATTEVRKVA